VTQTTDIATAVSLSLKKESKPWLTPWATHAAVAVTALALGFGLAGSRTPASSAEGAAPLPAPAMAAPAPLQEALPAVPRIAAAPPVAAAASDEPAKPEPTATAKKRVAMLAVAPRKSGGTSKTERAPAAVAQPAPPPTAVQPAATPAPTHPPPGHVPLDAPLTAARGGPRAAPHAAAPPVEKPAPRPSSSAKPALGTKHIVVVMGRLAPKIKACYKKYQVRGLASTRITVRPDGSVSRVSVQGPLSGTSTGQCVQQAVEGARFPESQGMSFDFPVPVR
jgi:hypothetical protein